MCGGIINKIGGINYFYKCQKTDIATYRIIYTTFSILLDVNQVRCLDMSSFSPISTVESAISDGFSQMLRLHMLAASKIGNGSCHF